MLLLLIFGILLYIAVLFSHRTERGVLSTAVLFLVGGFVVGESALGLIHLKPDAPFIQPLTEIALVAVLFVDGMSFDARAIRRSWTLPTRALALGMPLTLLGFALLAHYLVGLGWLQAFLVGAVLSPTDPVFAAAIVKREEVPVRLRRMLNVESGFNDGLALPVVMVLLAMLGSQSKGLLPSLEELALGLIIGVLIPWLAIMIGRRSFGTPTEVYQPLNALAIGIVVLALADLLSANLFFAAFAAGITLTTICPEVRDSFRAFGESITELLKLGVLLIFGAAISLEVVATLGLGAYLLAILGLILVRPLSIQLAMLGSATSWQERLVAGWFGPKGFASIFYGLLVWRADSPQGAMLFSLIALVVSLSIIAHSSSDVLIARWLHRSIGDQEAPREGLPSTD